MTDNASLQGTWIVMSYRSGDEMVAPDDRTEARVTIAGTLVAGSMGLNRFSGHFEGDLPVGPLATTRMAGPPGLMLQEDILVGHLQDADAIEVDEDGMTWRLDGLLLVELERSGTDDSVATS